MNNNDFSSTVPLSGTKEGQKYSRLTGGQFVQPKSFLTDNIKIDKSEREPFHLRCRGRAKAGRLQLSMNLMVRASYLGCKEPALIPAFSPRAVCTAATRRIIRRWFETTKGEIGSWSQCSLRKETGGFP